MTKPIVSITLRAKKLGVLLRDARLAHCKSVDDCAHILGIDAEVFSDYEFGRQSPSLPELELLAYYLDLPLEHFSGRVAMSESQDSSRTVDSGRLIGLRQREIGVLVRKARLDVQLSLHDLSDRVGLPIERLEAFELGSLPIPLPELEAIAAALQVNLRNYHDHHSPVGAWFNRRRVVGEFLELPEDLQAFVAKPVNRPYLELAQRLSEMSVDKLRSVAEGLLEITY